MFRWLILLLAAVPTQALAEGEGSVTVSDIVRWKGLVSSILLVAAVAFLLRWLRGFVEKLSTQIPAQRLLIQQISTIVQFLTYIALGIAVVALSVRLDERGWAFVGGSLAVGIGFATKDLIASFLAGLIIMVDRPFRVGDRVMFSGEYGDVTRIGLRSVRIQTLDDNTVTIPNNKFLNDVTSCGNYGALHMQVVIDFFCACDANIQLAEEIVRESALTSRYVHLPSPVVVLVNQQIVNNYFAIRLRLKAYVLDTKYEKALESEVTKRALKGFAKAHISPPRVMIDGNPQAVAVMPPDQSNVSA